MKIKEGSNRLLFAYMATIGIIKILLTTNLPIFANPNAGYDDADFGKRTIFPVFFGLL